MPRVKRGMRKHRRHNKYLAYAKGYWGRRSDIYRTAREAVENAWQQAYKGRKEKKRNFRKLWITRINAASRVFGLSYSKFIHGLKEADVQLDRKSLADIAARDIEGFENLVEVSKEHLNASAEK